MKAISIKKSILGLFFIAYMLMAHPSKAIGLATGPSLGMAGFYSSFESKQQRSKISMDNLGLQIGCFAQLDLWLVYAKLDALYVLDWHKLPNKLDREHFKYITLPFTIGVPFLSLFRPHIGLVFRIPLDELGDTEFKGNRLIESYRKKINGYIWGLGIDLGHFLMDIYCEFARSAVVVKSINADLVDDQQHYRPKQIGLRFSYNLLG